MINNERQPTDDRAYDDRAGRRNACYTDAAVLLFFDT